MFHLSMKKLSISSCCIFMLLYFGKEVAKLTQVMLRLLCHVSVGLVYIICQFFTFLPPNQQTFVILQLDKTKVFETSDFTEKC